MLLSIQFNIFNGKIVILSSLHIADPFDLNHNLGAGLSRKSMIISACFYPYYPLFLYVSVFSNVFIFLSSYISFFYENSD